MDILFDIDFWGLVNHFFFPFVRIISLVITAPITGEKSIPARVKIGLSLLIIFLLPQSLVPETLTIFSLVGIWVTIQQIIIGIAIGFTMQLAFMTVRFAGELMGMQMGLSIATYFDPTGGPSTPVIARILNVVAILIFLIIDGHLWLLFSLSESFYIVPISGQSLSVQGYLTLIETSTQLFNNGLLLALPLIVLLLIINMALGLLNRLTPQLSIFVVGLPVTLLLGLLTLWLLVPNIVSYSEHTFSLFFDRLATVLHHFS